MQQWRIQGGTGGGAQKEKDSSGGISLYILRLLQRPHLRYVFGAFSTSLATAYTHLDVYAVANALNRHASQFIRFLTDEASQRHIKAKFYDIAAQLSSERISSIVADK